MYRLISWIAHSKFSPIIILTIIISGIYYKFFLFGKIPFPGDLLVVSYSPWLDYYKFPVQNPLISDVFSQFFLWKYLAIDAFGNWQWPLWNPYSFMGTPLLATYHSAVLYPLNILLLLPKYYGWGFYIFSQTLLAAIFFYLFISQIVRSKLAGLTGAIIFSLGGLMTTWLELGTAVHAMAWLPLALYSISKFALSQKFRYPLLLTASLSLIILSGNAQITTYSFIIVSIYSLWLYINKEITSREIPFLFFALLLPLFITAAQLLPSFDLLQNSIRQTEGYSKEANFGLLNIKDAFKLFIPDYFGNEVTRNYWGTLNYSETSAFLGVFTLPLLIYGLLKVRSKNIFFFFMLFFISLLFAFDNSISRSFYNLPIPLLTSSYGSRMLFVTLLSAGIISSLTINDLIRYKNLHFFQKTLVWSWSAISGLILGTLLTYHLIENILNTAPNENYLKVYLSNQEYALQNFIIAARNSLIPLAFLTAILVFLFILNRLRFKFLIKNKLNILLAALFLLVILDLGRYFLKFNPFVSQNLVFPRVPALQFLQEKSGIFRVGREHAEVLPPNTWIAYGMQSIEGYDPVYLMQYGKFFNFLNGGDIRTGNANRYAELVNYKSPFLDQANLKYFIGIGRDRTGHIPGDFFNYKFEEAGYKKVFKEGSAVIFENPNAKERVQFAEDIITTSNDNIQKIIMEDKNFTPAKTVLLTEDLKISSVTGKGETVITSYSPNEIKIKTTTNSDEVLVLADQYEPGWKAEIDGQETKISPANIIFRAVKVPAGSHEVIFSYWPASFDFGLKISSASLLLITLISLLQIRARRW